MTAQLGVVKRSLGFCLAVVFSLQAQNGGVIEGTVTNKVSGRSIAGAKVIFRLMADTRGPGVYATTDEAGRYHLSFQSAGDYLARVEADGYVTSAEQPTHLLRDLRLDFDLVPLSILSGRVMDELGHPASNAKVELYKYRGARLQVVNTTSDGVFILSGVRDGTYSLLVHPPGSIRDAYCANSPVVSRFNGTISERSFDRTGGYSQWDAVHTINAGACVHRRWPRDRQRRQADGPRDDPTSSA